MSRNRANPNDDTYAKFNLNADKSCPFFDSARLCSIQRSLGEKYLSLTCRYYPRHYNIVNGIWEKSAYLSCPEAARLALLNTGIMEFDLNEEDVCLPTPNHGILITGCEKKNKPEEYFEELRVFTISLLQNRLYPLWQRLIILGLFYENLGKLISANQADGTVNLINNFLDYLKQGIFHNSLSDIPTHSEIQLQIIKQLLEITFAITSKNDHFAGLFNEAMHGINYSKEVSEEELSARYAFVHDNYYRKVAFEHEYIMENYLVHYVFMNLFPFTNKNCVFDNYVMLILHYAMIKMMLIGMAGFYKEGFNPSHMVKLIQALTKVITHNDKHLEMILDILKSKNINKMTFMSILIKN